MLSHIAYILKILFKILISCYTNILRLYENIDDNDHVIVSKEPITVDFRTLEM